jgi:hypothetical protein
MVAAAELLDELVSRHVLAALGALDPDAAMKVIEHAESERHAVQDGQRRLLQRAESDVQTAKKLYTEVGTEHPLVRADLLASYEDAIRRRDKMKEAVEASGVLDTIPFTPKDASRLNMLTQHLEALWSASTTTNEDRKRVLRLALQRVIVLTATKEDVDVELVWEGGHRERLHLNRRAELDRRVRELRSGGTVPEAIVHELRAAGIPSMSGKPASRDIVRKSLERVGLNRAALRQPILTRVYGLLVEQRSRKDIMAILDQEFPLTGRTWTHDRLYRIIRRLKDGVPGLSPLPAGIGDKRDTSEALALIKQWRSERKTWRAIASDLNALGLRPSRAKTFSLFQTMELARRHGIATETRGEGHAR